MKTKLTPDVERDAIRWVGNLPDATAQAMVQKLRRRYPGRLITERDYRTHIMIDIMIGVIENRGYIKQDHEFQGMLETVNFNAWSISRRLDRVYNSLPKKLKDLRA